MNYRLVSSKQQLIERLTDNLAFTEQKNEMIRKDLLDEALRCAVTIGMRRTSVEFVAADTV